MIMSWSLSTPSVGISMHALAADTCKSKLWWNKKNFKHHLISTEYINIANEMKWDNIHNPGYFSLSCSSNCCPLISWARPSHGLHGLWWWLKERHSKISITGSRALGLSGKPLILATDNWFALSLESPDVAAVPLYGVSYPDTKSNSCRYPCHRHHCRSHAFLSLV
jgi:hypothetical protein